jgi:hypothetical protein
MNAKTMPFMDFFKETKHEAFACIKCGNTEYNKKEVYLFTNETKYILIRINSHQAEIDNIHQDTLINEFDTKNINKMALKKRICFLFFNNCLPA